MSDKLFDGKKLYITDVTLRDAHQSLLATRMRTEDMLPIADKMDKAGFWSMEVWGGATFDACLRFLKEDPWERLRKLRKALPNTRLQMLLRGQNILGYRHYPDDVLKKFIETARKNGIDVFRVFDALNDLRNLRVSIETAKSVGAIVEGAISYTTSPIHTIKYFVELAKGLAGMGVDIITIKDMAGLILPRDAYTLVKAIKEEVGLPVSFHSHCTTGLCMMAHYEAIRAGADVIDAAISPLSLGTSHPPIESMVAAFKNTDRDTGLDLKLLSEIAEYFKKVRKKYKRFETEFYGVDPRILVSQIPGGMLSNLINQLREQNALDKLDAVLEEVPRVRKDLGYPPLVTPTSQIVGTQATLNVMTGERYSVITTEVKNYIKGMYGQPPGEIDSELMKKAIGDEKPITVRPADLLEPELDKLTRELGDKAKSIEDILSYALFPQVALEFFEQREKGELKPEPIELPEEEKASVEEGEGRVHFAPSEFKITVHGETYHVKVAGAGHRNEVPRPYFIKIDGQLEEILLEPLVEIVPSSGGVIESTPAVESKRPMAQKKGDITTPLPGKVTKVLVKEGDFVTEGDTVLVIEAMKLENEIHTPVTGFVKKVYVKEGDQVHPKETLVEIEEKEN